MDYRLDEKVKSPWFRLVNPPIAEPALAGFCLDRGAAPIRNSCKRQPVIPAKSV